MNTSTTTADNWAIAPPWTMTVTRIVRPAAPPPINDADDRLLLALYFDRARSQFAWPSGWTLQRLSYDIDHGMTWPEVLAALARLVAERRLYWFNNIGLFVVPEDAPDWLKEPPIGP